MILYCNASNMHSGGGKTLIIDFINHAIKKNNIKFVFFIDKRLVLPKIDLEHIQGRQERTGNLNFTELNNTFK